MIRSALHIKVKQVVSHFSRMDVETVLDHLEPLCQMIMDTHHIDQVALYEEILREEQVTLNLMSMVLPTPPKGQYKLFLSLRSLLESENRAFETAHDLKKATALAKETILRTSSKLMPNYVSVWGVPPSHVQQHPFYDQDTKLLISNKLRNGRGIRDEDVYHVVLFDLFRNVESVRWLLFEKDGVSAEEVMAEVFPVEESPTVQDVLTTLDRGQNPSAKYTLSTVHWALMKGLIFFQKFYHPTTKDGFVDFKLPERRLTETDDLRLDFRVLINNLRILEKHNDWSNFLRDSRNKLRSTWYGHHKLPSTWYGHPSTIPVSRREVHAFAEAFARPLNGEFKLWWMLSDIEREEARSRLCDESTNLVRLLPMITYESLSVRGLLSVVSFRKPPPFMKDMKEAPHSPFLFKKESELEGFDTPKFKEWRMRDTVQWSAQLCIMHRFLHNRVMYVSAATGAGKTTEIPKLLLYASSALLHRNDFKLVCTQPRKTPTQNNSTYVAEEIGLNASRVNNYVIQTYTSENNTKHIPPKGFYTTSFLRFSTDGALLQKIQTNPILRKYRKNEWDAIIIDESHEHNANMDLILTLMKNTLLVNPDILLVIMSATLEGNDETRYRRFFMDIKDMKDQADRRIHIGLRTNFHIHDEYLKDSLEEDFQKVENKAVEKITQLVSQTTKGDILYFTTGRKNIHDITESLNEILPTHVIAIPFYGTLPSSFRTKILPGKIQENVNLIAGRRTELFKNLDIPDNPRKNPRSNYSRVIIVATNVAEASITINTLKYVVDSGFVKESSFDPLLGGSVLNIQRITESSRIQRRGRVGRKSEGSVFYMYKHRSRENVQDVYGICSEDLYDDLLYIRFSTEDFWKDKTAQILEEKYGLTVTDDLLQRVQEPLNMDRVNNTQFLIHPDEGSKLKRLKYVQHVLSRLPVIRTLLHEKDSHLSIRNFILKINMPEISIYNVISFLVAWSIRGERALRVVVEYVVQRLNTGEAMQQQLKDELTTKFLEHFRGHSKSLVSLPSNLSDEQVRCFSLYFSNPLALAKYSTSKGRWVNVFSQARLNMSEHAPYSTFAYNRLEGSTPIDILPLNNLCFEYISTWIHKSGDLLHGFYYIASPSHTLNRPPPPRSRMGREPFSNL